MKTFWQGGDIITAEKLNNIEKNSQNNLFICLNDYQDEQDNSLLLLSKNQIHQLFNKGAFLYYYYYSSQNGITYLFQREFSEALKYSLIYSGEKRICLFYTPYRGDPLELYFNYYNSNSVQIQVSEGGGEVL